MLSNAARPSSQPSIRAQVGDQVMAIAIAIAALAALALGFTRHQLGLATAVAGALLAVAVIGRVALAAGARRYVFTFVLVGLVALHIQLAAGQLEFHFGVFVVLAFLLVYLDWTVILLGAGLFAVHHIVFDRMQAAGFGLFCTAQADFARVLLHAAYVVVQAGVELVLVRSLRRAAQEGEELGAIVERVGDNGRICLALGSLTVQSRAARSLADMLQRMEAAVSAVQQGASGVEVASSEIAAGNQDLSRRTERTAANLQRTHNSMLGLTDRVQQSATHARDADRLAQAASALALQGGAVVHEVVATMTGIDESSRRIADIIGVIDGIAFQTNILALNAAVEAARAGEQGRGFAVVAGEVRGLAQRSAAAAKEIKTLIGSSVERVEQGTALAARAGTTMTELVQSIRRVTDIVGEISAASEQQARGVVEVGQAVHAMDQATQQNAALVEEVAAAAASLRRQAGELMRTMAVFDMPARG